MSICPTWCAWGDVGMDCNGDHWASPGGVDWPAIAATASDGVNRELVCAAPTWGESDGLAPAVLLWLQRLTPTDVELVSETFDFTPAEARQVAARLIAGAEAVEVLKCSA